jgi:hypothetical protein
MTPRSTRPPETKPGTLTTPEGASERQAVLDAERAKWLTIKDAAYVLRTSVSIIRRLLRSQLPHRKEGKIIRIHLDDLRPQPREVSHDESITTAPRAAASESAFVAAARRRFRALHGRGTGADQARAQQNGRTIKKGR